MGLPQFEQTVEHGTMRLPHCSKDIAHIYIYTNSETTHKAYNSSPRFWRRKMLCQIAVDVNSRSRTFINTSLNAKGKTISNGIRALFAPRRRLDVRGNRL